MDRSSDYTQNEAMGWDDELSEERHPYQALPDGDYDFEVAGFERSRFAGSEKMSPCPQAVLKLKIYGNGLESTLTHRLNLHKKSEIYISEFFISIGLKKPGEKCKMQWNRVVGSKGRCRIGSRVYNGNTYNEVKEFYPPDEAGVKKQTGFTPGQF